MTESMVVYRLEGLHCVGCTQKILGALSDKYAGSKWDFSLATGILEGVGITQSIARQDIQLLVNRYESDVFVLPTSKDNEAEVEVIDSFQSKFLMWFNKRTTRIAIGGIALVLSFIVEAFGFIATEELALLMTIFVLGAYIFVGLPVVRRAFSNVIKGEWFDENFLMTVATFGAIILGEIPEALGVMVFYELGEHFQSKAVNQSRRAIEKLLEIRPDKAHLIVGEKMWDVPSEQLTIGDELFIKPGERVPTDAILTSERAYVDTSSMTGESKPRLVEKGERLIGGYINLQQAIYCKVDKLFLESTASRLIQLVQQAADKKAKPEQFMTKFAKIYTPIVMLLSLLTAILPPLVLGESFSIWAYRALIFLVISCPCALVISIPLSYFGGIGAASKMGVLIKGGNYLEALSQLSEVYFDKTGTLTQGKFQVHHVELAEGVSHDKLLYWASVAEQNSLHPIGMAIRKAAEGLNVSETRSFNMSETAGEGIRISKENLEVIVGKHTFVKTHLSGFELERLANVDKRIVQHEKRGASTVVHVAHNQSYLGAIILSDVVKNSSQGAIGALKQMDIAVTMLSGDRSETVENLAKQLEIKSFYGDLKPHDKLQILEKAFQVVATSNAKGKIAFVGDGINDAPVIARADIGIAMGGIGSEAAIEAADVVLMHDEPESLISAIELARRTRNIVYQNIVMALGIKIVFMSLGVAGLSGMWEAIFADVGVALLAVLNAMRLLPKE